MAAKVSLYVAFEEKASWKSVQDRYRRLQEQFDKDDDADRGRSGVGGGVTEMEELLSMMREERDDLDAKKTAETKAEKEREKEKDHVGRQVVEAALSRKKRKTLDTDDSEEEREAEKSAKKKKGSFRQVLTGELAEFGAQLKKADECRIALER